MQPPQFPRTVLGWLRMRLPLATAKLPRLVRNQVSVPLDAELDFPQPAVWAKYTLIVTISGMTLAIAWAVFARIDTSVTARGKLEPISGSRSVQAQTAGIIKSVLVQPGTTVKAGQSLMTLQDSTLDIAQLFNNLNALLKQREPIVQEIESLTVVRGGQSISENQMRGLNRELVSKIQSQRLLTIELSLNRPGTDLTTQLNSTPPGLDGEQLDRYRSFVQKLIVQDVSKQIEIATLQAQAAGTQAQSAAAESQLRAEQELLAKLTPLAQAGGISYRDYLKQGESTTQARSQFAQSLAAQQQLQINQLQAEVSSSKTVVDLFREAEDQLAAVNKEFDDIIKADRQKLTDIDAQVAQIQAKLKPQEITSPISGVVFQLATQVAGTVVQPGQALAQVTPTGPVVLRAQVPSTDLASVKVGMPVEIGFDAYSYTKYRKMSGSVSRIDSEAIPVDPNQKNGQTVFPIEVRLDQPFFQDGDTQLPLAPGMAATLNIKSKVGARSPASIVFEPFWNALHSLESIH